MRISRKLVNVARASTGALVIAVGGTLIAPDHPAVLVIIAGAAAGGVVLAARTVIHRAVPYRQLPVGQRAAILRWVTASAAAHTVWVALYVTRPDLAWHWLAGLAGMAGLSYLVARGQEYLMTHPPAVPVPATPAGTGTLAARPADPAAAGAAAEMDRACQLFEAALGRTEWGYVQVLGSQQIDAGRQFLVRIPSRYAGTEDDNGPSKKSSSRRPFGRDSAEGLAIALSEVLGVGLMTDWVAIERRPEAGQWTVTVLTRDVMADVIPYQDDLTVRTLRTPVLVGYDVTGAPHHLMCAAHGQIVGMSRYGKTSLANNLIAFALLHATVWVAGTEKLYDLLAGWLAPYEADQAEAPFDWMAHGQDDVLAVLVAAMTVARRRQARRLDDRVWDPLVVVLDEASFPLSDTTTKATYQGQDYTASELLAMITKGAGSSDVYAWVITQRGTNGQFGDKGGDVKTNFGWAAAGRSKDPAELGRTLGDHKLPRPRHRGEFWLDPGEGDLVRIKVPYIQEADPSKPRLHDGPTVSDIAAARRDRTVPLDEDSARALDGVPAYARRHRRVDEALLAYLTGTAATPAPAPATPTPSPAGAGGGTTRLRGRAAGIAAAQAELRELGLLPPAAAPSSAQAPPPPAVTPVPPPPANRRDRILATIRDSPTGILTTAEIVEELESVGDKITNRTAVTNELGKMVAAGDLVRPEKGVYRLAPLRSVS